MARLKPEASAGFGRRGFYRPQTSKKGGAAQGSPAMIPTRRRPPSYIFPSVISASRTCASVKLAVFGYFWMISR
jgi:hypothetical protein